MPECRCDDQYRAGIEDVIAWLRAAAEKPGEGYPDHSYSGVANDIEEAFHVGQ